MTSGGNVRRSTHGPQPKPSLRFVAREVASDPSGAGSSLPQVIKDLLCTALLKCLQINFPSQHFFQLISRVGGPMSLLCSHTGETLGSIARGRPQAYTQ